MAVILVMAGVRFLERIQQKSIEAQLMLADMSLKTLWPQGFADKCEVQLSYAIGVARPVSIFIETFGTNKVPEDELLKAVEESIFELRPAGLIQTFGLDVLPSQREGRFYQEVASYGHFGRTDLDLPWEALDKVEALKAGVCPQKWQQYR